MTTDRIGQAAGSIWQKLHEKSTAGLLFADLKKIAGFTTDEALAGIGWLAREGKLSLKENPQKKLTATLVEEESYV